MDLRIVGVQGRASRLGVHAGRISNCHLGQFPFRGQTGSQTARSPVMTYLQIRVRDALSCPWRIPMKPLLFALCVMSDRKSTPELQSPCNLVCRLLIEKKKKINILNCDRLAIRRRLFSHTITSGSHSPVRSIPSVAHGPMTSHSVWIRSVFFFFNGPGAPEIQPFSPPRALPI